MTHQYTQRDFKAFVAEARRCLKKLGMTEWEVQFDFKKTRSDCYANFHADHVGKIAVVTLNSGKAYDMPLTGHDAKLTARHEIAELLLAPLSLMAGDARPEGMVDEEVHRIVRRLEKVL